MQSVIFSFSALSNMPLAESVARRKGSRFIGQAKVHFAHLIHGLTAFLTESVCGNNTIPDVPFTTGTPSPGIALPIIGPPLIILPVSSGCPPAASMRFLRGVPTLTR